MKASGHKVRRPSRRSAGGANVQCTLCTVQVQQNVRLFNVQQQQECSAAAGETNGNPCCSLPTLHSLHTHPPAYLHNPKTHTGVSLMGSNEWRLGDEEVGGGGEGQAES